MTVKTRASVPSDGEIFKRILQQPGVLEYFPMESEREIDDSVRIWEIFCNKGASITAEVDGKPVGLVFLNLHPYKKIAHQCIITALVDESYRNRGVGTRLLEDLIPLARDTFELELLHLEVYATNPAKRLYERLGFEVYGVHKKYIKEGDRYIDKILMQRSI